MRPSINWVVSESALSCCLAAVWRNSWVLRSVRSVLVPGYHFHPCIVLASIFFLDCPYRVVHPGFWFGILPVGGWSAYSKSTNFCSCSSPFFVVLLHSSVFSKRSVVVAVWVLSVRDTVYSLPVILGHGAGSVKIADHQYEEHVLFVSSQIYYWVQKCTTHHYYTNIIKTI